MPFLFTCMLFACNSVRISLGVAHIIFIRVMRLHGESYMGAHVLLNLLNKLRKRDKMQGC